MFSEATVFVRFFGLCKHFFAIYSHYSVNIARKFEKKVEIGFVKATLVNFGY